MPPLTQLFCFPCAGAGAAPYLNWRRIAPSWLQILPLERPGRGFRSREEPIREFIPLVAYLVREILRQCPKRYVLFGHSFGALLAWECANQLQSSGLTAPLALLVASCPAPAVAHQTSFAKDWSQQDLVQELRRLNGTPAGVIEDQDMLAMAVEQLGADYAARGDFKGGLSRDRLAVPIHVYGGKTDDIPISALEGWRDVTSSSFSLTMVEGGHFFFHNDSRSIVARIVKNIGIG